MENSTEEKSDGLEIISIGTLYQGSWDKKYWSSSRGKDRFPYPIGYHAVRTHIGIIYSMEIREGLKGPLFVITANDGESSSGQTPDIAWEQYQKKGGPRVKLGLGKRFSCRIEGVELFGFRNPLVQRLLRELVTNSNGTAERSLLSSSVNNENYRLDPQEAEPPNSCIYPDLLPHLIKPAMTRKRSRRHNITTINSVGGADLKKIQNQKDLVDVEVAITRRENWRHRREERCLTSSGSDEDHQICTNTGASPEPVDVTTLAHDASLVKDSPQSTSLKFVESLGGDATIQQECKDIIPEDSMFTCMANNPSKQEKHECTSLLETEDKIEEMMYLIDSKTNLDPCAPDTLDGVQDVVADSVPDSYKENSCHPKDELSLAYAVDSEELATSIRPKEDFSTPISNASSKMDSDSVGQDLASSMMTLLLPQALPLLKMNFSKRQPVTHSSEICRTNEGPCLEPSGASTAVENDGLCNTAVTPGKLEVGMPAETLHLDREEGMHTFGKVRGSDFLSYEDVNYVIPDSLEDGQSDNHVIHVIGRRPPCSDFVEQEGMNTFGKVRGSDFLSSEDVNYVIPDSLEDGQSGNNVIGRRPPCSDFVEHDQALFHQKVYKPDTSRLFGCANGAQESSVFHIRIGGVKSFNGEVHETQNKKDHVVLPDCINDAPSLEPTSLLHNHSCASHSESLPKCDITNLNPENELADSPNRLQSKETALSPSSCTATKDMEIACSEICEKKLVQYQRRRRSTSSKLQNTNLNSEQADPNTHGNQDSLNMQRLSTVSYINDANMKRTERSAFVSCEEVAPGTTKASPIQMPSLSLSDRKYNGPLTESIICRSAREDCVPETYTATQSLLATEIDQASGSIIDKNVSFGCEIKPDGQHQRLSTDNQKAKYEDVSSFTGLSISGMERHKLDSVNEVIGPHNLTDSNNSLSWSQEWEKNSFHNNGLDTEDILANFDFHPHLKPVNGKDCRNLLSDSELNQDYLIQDRSCTVKAEPNKGSESYVELLGCYLHPTPVLSILLSMQGDNIHICVLCGLLQDRNMSIFIYKIPSEQPTGGCPSFLGYTSIMLPISNSTWCRMNVLERSGWQFTPNGQCLILPNNIKAPACREGSIICSCSQCTSDSFEENAVKVVNVKLGYVSLVAKLKTVESVHCVLVCEPSHLVAAEKSGRLHVWVMNSKWSAGIEEFVLPSLDYMTPCIVELKRVPKCDSLIVGHDGFGDFGLWDVSKRILLSRFSAPGNSVFQVLPVSFFSCQNKGHFSSIDIEEQIKSIMASTEMFSSGFTEDHVLHSSTGEDLAVWLLISATGDSEVQFNHQENGINPNPVGCWRLALLMKNIVILGGVLDPRASAINASAGHGVIGTSDGLVYMWELSTGRKLVDLHYFKGSRVSCIASDPKSGVVAVANGEGQLLVYATLSKAIEKLKSK